MRSDRTHARRPRPRPAQPRAALCARVSTVGHGEDVGLQLDELFQVADQPRWDVVGIYEDAGGAGGGSAPGPGGHGPDRILGEVESTAPIWYPFRAVSWGRRMQLHWNSRYRDLIGGLDILGVRQVDQSLELELVGGLTTVAPRARYLSLLTWALSAMYEHGKSTDGAELHGTLAQQNAVLTRFEFLVAVATQVGARTGEPGSTTGIVGSDVYREALFQVSEEGGSALPDARRPGVLNAYGSPMQGFGLTHQVAGGPLAIAPRGRELFDSMGIPDAVTALLFEGHALAPSNVEVVSEHLSLNGLQRNQSERIALLAALDEAAPSGGSRAVARTERFRATRVWAIRMLEQAPSSADGLVDRAYADLVQGRASTPIAMQWGEVALRKRVHFALELLLSALAATVEPNRGSSVTEVIESLFQAVDGHAPCPELAEAIGKSPVDFHAPWAEWRDRVASDAFLDTPPSRTYRDLGHAWQLVAAMALLVAAERQSRSAVLAGQVPDRQRALESTLPRVREVTGSFAGVTANIVRTEVAARHLRHTMRKMSQGQNNSLRFFPRGERLVPTGVGTAPGFSLTRLSAVLQVLADLGHLQWTQSGFAPTSAGLDWAKEASA